MDLYVLRSPVSTDCDAPKQPRLRRVRKAGKMKTITEAEAQEYANKWRVWIAVDKNELVFWYVRKPVANLKADHKHWQSESGASAYLPFRISSDRQWTEQIWRPE